MFVALGIQHVMRLCCDLILFPQNIINSTIFEKKNQQVLSTIVLMLDVITSFNFLFFPNDGLKK
jgi:hypothetical protein